MVLQRYALRFTISDATLDSLKVPRSAANSKRPADGEHKPQSDETKPAKAETSSAAQQHLKSASDSSSSSPTLSPVTIWNDVPAQSQQKSADKMAEEQQEQQQLIAGDPKPLSKPAAPQMAQPQPNITQPAHHTLPSPQSGACRTLPLLAAKPYCQPKASQSGHKPVKVRDRRRLRLEGVIQLIYKNVSFKHKSNTSKCI